jgi:hypothetical protein
VNKPEVSVDCFESCFACNQIHVQARRDAISEKVMERDGRATIRFVVKNAVR